MEIIEEKIINIKKIHFSILMNDHILFVEIFHDITAYHSIWLFIRTKTVKDTKIAKFRLGITQFVNHAFR